MSKDAEVELAERYLAAWLLDEQQAPCNPEPGQPLCWAECKQSPLPPYCRRQSDLRW